VKKEYYIKLQNALTEFSVKIKVHKNELMFSKEDATLCFFISEENHGSSEHMGKMVLPLDYLMTQPEKITAIVLSKLKLNKTVYARSCEIRKVDKKTAEDFLEYYHLFGSTQSAINLGLYSQDELLALTSFSKGRKMNRLHQDQRSFELIRFCCKSGITVTGGLTRLVKNFCAEKKAGDVMTYVDRQLSEGKSFINAGFKKHSEAGPNYFLIDRKSFQRHSAKKDDVFDPTKFYMTQNAGSIKLIYTPNE
jgi:hypothetical protein